MLLYLLVASSLAREVWYISFTALLCVCIRSIRALCSVIRCSCGEDVNTELCLPKYGPGGHDHSLKVHKELVHFKIILIKVHSILILLVPFPYTY